MGWITTNAAMARDMFVFVLGSAVTGLVYICVQYSYKKTKKVWHK